MDFIGRSGRRPSLKENIPPGRTMIFSAVRLWILIFLLAGTAYGRPPFFEAPDARFEDPAVNESSGLVKSRRFDGIFWTHNDSGDRARIFAVTREGRSVGTVEIAGARNVDWEDIAIDDAGFLYLCDIGDNRNRRTDLVVYRVPEVDPRRVRAATVAARFPFRYPALRSPDTEACFFSNGAVYLLTKEHGDDETNLYRLDLSRPERAQVASFIGKAKVDGLVTGADLSPDGSRLAVLTYTAVHLFQKPGGSENYLAGEHRRLSLLFGQAEAIAWDGEDLIITNESGEILRKSIQD
ncbi:MAG: hypothetical protein EPO39_07705 [Candidatus Manganitrophaceae bacterium]|nr:MAG: hypothetical protein EPO39_07705 [Candidatus Manganitrophaceae bacterium]